MHKTSPHLNSVGWIRLNTYEVLWTYNGVEVEVFYLSFVSKFFGKGECSEYLRCLQLDIAVVDDYLEQIDFEIVKDISHLQTLVFLQY